jgi:hypothetical protein
MRWIKAWLVGLLGLVSSIAGCSNGAVSASGGSGGSGGSGAGDTAIAGSSGKLEGQAGTTGLAGSGAAGAANASAGSTHVLSSVPTNHRPEDAECPRERGPGRASVVRDCTQDSDCTQGTNGRCISPNVVGPLGGSSCTYDTCFSGSDCPTNEPCRCRESAASNIPNVCVTGSNCRIDSDCGPGGFCSPSLFYLDSSISGSPTSGSGYATFGYFCHTPMDLCRNDSDCDQSTCDGKSDCSLVACGYSSVNRWDCFGVGTH